jgi:hypothetical protein
VTEAEGVPLAEGESEGLTESATLLLGVPVLATEGLAATEEDTALEGEIEAATEEEMLDVGEDETLTQMHVGAPPPMGGVHWMMPPGQGEPEGERDGEAALEGEADGEADIEREMHRHWPCGISGKQLGQGATLPQQTSPQESVAVTDGETVVLAVREGETALLTVTDGVTEGVGATEGVTPGVAAVEEETDGDTAVEELTLGESIVLGVTLGVTEGETVTLGVAEVEGVALADSHRQETVMSEGSFQGRHTQVPLWPGWPQGVAEAVKVTDGVTLQEMVVEPLMLGETEGG